MTNYLFPNHHYPRAHTATHYKTAKTGRLFELWASTGVRKTACCRLREKKYRTGSHQISVNATHIPAPVPHNIQTHHLIENQLKHHHRSSAFHPSGVDKWVVGLFIGCVLKWRHLVNTYEVTAGYGWRDCFAPFVAAFARARPCCWVLACVPVCSVLRGSLLWLRSVNYWLKTIIITVDRPGLNTKLTASMFIAGVELTCIYFSLTDLNNLRMAWRNEMPWLLLYNCFNL